MERSQKTKLTPAIRFCAAMSLAVWLASLFFCSADCFFGKSQCEPGLHDAQAAASHHDNGQVPDSGKHDGCDSSFCDSLKTVVHTANNNLLLKPDFGFCVLSFVSLPQALTVAHIEAPVFRQPPDSEWLFTPAVFLGPAFRSHAPPVLL